MHRLHGMRHMQQGRYLAAEESFCIAARYADKFSQAAYAKMLWEGRPGISQDRPLAYAWMDLAAEHGDDVAKQRQERVMEKARRSATGSRLGANNGNLRVIPAENSALLGSNLGKALMSGGGISGHDFYHDRYWAPQNHWARQDYESEVTLGGNPRPRV